MAKSYQPPFQASPKVIDLIAQISEILGLWSISMKGKLTPRLRRINRIRSIQASLAIENNTLSLEQVTAILEGKRVLGLPKEIQEVRNAFATYEKMNHWKSSSLKDLLAAHKILMKGLIDEPGCFREGSVGIYRGKKVVHMAPPANRVSILMNDLLNWLEHTDFHPLIVSCIFHYEFEFIHPFVDGNGRMGRLWQTLILSRWQPIFASLPVETVVHKKQQKYYKALGDSNDASSAMPFVEFMLQAIYDAMKESSLKDSLKSSLKTEGRILALLRENNAMTIPEVAKALKLSSRAIDKQIEKLKKQGRLQRVGADKGGYWEVI
jgi:Fic family protein